MKLNKRISLSAICLSLIFLSSGIFTSTFKADKTLVFPNDYKETKPSYSYVKGIIYTGKSVPFSDNINIISWDTAVGIMNNHGSLDGYYLSFVKEKSFVGTKWVESGYWQATTGPDGGGGGGTVTPVPTPTPTPKPVWVDTSHYEYLPYENLDSKNAYWAREIFESPNNKDWWKGDTPLCYDDHGYHSLYKGNEGSLMKDDKVLVYYAATNGFAQVKYKSSIVYIPVSHEGAWKNAKIYADDGAPALTVNFQTKDAYKSDANNYTDATEDFILNFETVDNSVDQYGGGINHVEITRIQYNKAGNEVSRVTWYSNQGPPNDKSHDGTTFTRYYYDGKVSGTANLGKQYGIFKIMVTSYDAAGNSTTVNSDKFYVDRIHPKAPAYVMESSNVRDTIDDPFKIKITYSDDIDTGNNSGESFSGIREAYYYLTTDENYTPSKSDYIRVKNGSTNVTTTGKALYSFNIDIKEPGNWYLHLKAVDYTGFESYTKASKPFVIAEIDTSTITIEPDATVDIASFATLKMLINGLTTEQLNNPATQVKIDFRAWWDDDPYQNNGKVYTCDNSIEKLNMVKDSAYENDEKYVHQTYFNFMTPMGILGNKESVTINIPIILETPGFGHDISARNSVQTSINLTITNTKNLSTYITDNKK